MAKRTKPYYPMTRIRTSSLAEADASVAMVYLMHICAAATIAAARPGAAVARTLQEIAAGRHFSTLAFSEAGSRSHFWAPLSRARRNGAGVVITAKKSWVTSAGHAHSYVVSWRGQQHISRPPASSIWARVSAKACRRCAHNSRPCKSIRMGFRRASTT
jgi:alkylation response protein AidB-like acyl-CoA dehydrogenase